MAFSSSAQASSVSQGKLWPICDNLTTDESLMCRYIIFLNSRNVHVRYAATFLTYCGAIPTGGIYIAWATANAVPETARVVVTGVVPSIGTLGSISGKQLDVRSHFHYA